MKKKKKKRLPLREDWSFQTRKTAHLWEWGRFLAGLQRPDFTRFLKKEQEGQLPRHSCDPATQLPGVERGGPRGSPGEPRGHQRKWTPVLGVKLDVTRVAGSQNPGSWRAQGFRPAASQAHLHSPGAPCWALGLLPPLPTPAGLPFLWARSLLPTPTHVPTGKPSFWGRRVAAGSWGHRLFSPLPPDSGLDLFPW